MRVFRVLTPLVALLAVACQAVISADFSDYSTLPTECNPLAPAHGEPTFADCKDSQQCTSGTNRNAFRCTSSNGTSSAGESCTSDVDCAQGLGCVGGFCRVYCDTNQTAACQQGEVCKSLKQQSGSRTIGACIKSCELTNPASCAGGERCTVIDSEPLCAAANPKSLKAYEACATDLDCAQGFGCALIAHEPDTKSTPVSVCLRWAKQTSDCTSPEARVTPESAPTVNGTTFGSCFAPCDPLNSTAPANNFRTCGGGQRCSFLIDASKVNAVALCTNLKSPPKRSAFPVGM